ncbi:MAG: 4-hydroxyphenylacetate 3-hydroxylase N-terminal domain-containing protein [Candidatus Micrarchaeaceae archaeon]
MLRTDTQFKESLRDGRRVFYKGSLVEDVTTHEILKVAINHASSLFKWQNNNDYADLLVKEDKEHGRISSFYAIPHNSEDLKQRFSLIYQTTRFGRGMFNIVKAIGSDALFALMIVSNIIDKEYGTNYSRRVKLFYEDVVSKDLALSVAQTDVKGNRTKKPREQIDPDLYVHIVERRDDGIVVSGAKAHTTQSIASNEIIVIPTRSMTSDDKDYAVAFSVPPNSKGITLISRPMRASETARSDPSFIMGNNNDENETLTIFDHVFVPWERVFMAGEWKYAGLLASMFPTYHRFTAIAYRAAMADLYLGLGKLIAEHNGTSESSNVRRNIVKLMTYKEILFLAGNGAADFAELDDSTSVCVPNRVYTNVGKLFANENYLDSVKNLVDITGGLASTLPHSLDLENPEERDLLLKYLAGAIPGKAEERIKLISTVREIISSYGALFTSAMLHAEGSIEASIIELYRSYDYKESKKLALFASGIVDSL